MDLGLNEQQAMLQKSARQFLSDSYSDKTLALMAKDPLGYTPELWQSVVDLGWTALSIPEAYGGIGDFMDLCLILQEMGRAGFISPYFSTMVLGAGLIAAAGTEEQKKRYLPALAEGRLLVTVALTDDLKNITPAAVKLPAVSREGGFILNGEKLLVPDAGPAALIITAARTGPAEKEITLFPVETAAPGLTSVLLDTVAPDKYYLVSYKEVKIAAEAVLGVLNRGWQPVAEVLGKAAVAACAVMLGGAERVLDFTLSYARERQAFGHPIGAYQSIQHRCADMLIDLEGSRQVTYQAAWYLAQGLPSVREIAIAKAWVSQACRRIVTSSHQIHGAIGFTEDHVLHWYTRRARFLEFCYGDVNCHLNSLSRLLTVPSK
jgi:alkylation response protein AidB-like acyl-CoA dehydrogenase